jgi:hypothetical protein
LLPYILIGLAMFTIVNTGQYRNLMRTVKLQWAYGQEAMRQRRM